MFAELVMLVFIHDNLNHRITMTLFQVYALLSLSIANLLIPTTIVRDYGGREEEHEHESRINLARTPSLDIFYVMVLGKEYSTFYPTC